MRITILVCDVCQDRDRVPKEYRITSEGRTVTVARCEVHGVELEGLFGEREPARRPAKKTGGRGRATGVTTIEEIEAKKAKKAAPGRA